MNLDSPAFTTPPPRWVRASLALVIGAAGALTHYLQIRAVPSHPGDFGVAWFGARSLLHGVDPYPLIGPGLAYDWPWKPLYPATAMVAAMPLALFSQLTATLIFVFASCAFLAYAVTREGWFRMPMFVSAAFFVAAGAAQWSPLLTASIGMPILAAFYAAKPNVGLAMFSASTFKGQKIAIVAGVILLIASMLFLPSWPGEWLHNVTSDKLLAAPVVRAGGVLILLVALRWRRPEARMLMILALAPQTGSWYEILPLFLIPMNLRESMILVAVSSMGFVLQDYVMTARNEMDFNSQVGALMVALAYLPATIMILRRPNEGELPQWVNTVARKFARAA